MERATTDLLVRDAILPADAKNAALGAIVEIEHADTISRFLVDEASSEETVNLVETALLVDALNQTPLSHDEIRGESAKDQTLVKVKNLTISQWPTKVTEELRPFHEKINELSVYRETIYCGESESLYLRR